MNRSIYQTLALSIKFALGLVVLCSTLGIHSRLTTLPTSFILGFYLLGLFLFIARLKRLSAAIPLLSKPSIQSIRQPAVTLLAAAHNESQAIPTSVKSLALQSYKNFRCLFVNDRSTDDTGNLLTSFAEGLPHVSILHTPPDFAEDQGVYGKCRAFHYALPFISDQTRWLLLTDADVLFSFFTVESAVAYAEDNDLDLLTCIPGMVVGSIGEQIVLQDYWSRAFLHIEKPNSPLGIGAFMLVKFEVYLKCGGHQDLLFEQFEPAALANKIYKIGGRTGVVQSQDMVSVRMYSDMPKMLRRITEKRALSFARNPHSSLIKLYDSFIEGICPFILIGTFLEPPRMFGGHAAIAVLASFILFAIGFRNSITSRFRNTSWMTYSLSPLSTISNFIFDLVGIIRATTNNSYRFNLLARLLNRSNLWGVLISFSRFLPAAGVLLSDTGYLHNKVLVLSCWLLLLLQLCASLKFSLRAIRSLTNAPPIPQLDEESARPLENTSIIIPARNEESHIEQALLSHLNSQDENVKIIVINDSSTDKTGEILSAFQSRQGLVSMNNPSLRPGWLGKANAIWTATRDLNPHVVRWLLLTDADAIFCPHALRNLQNLANEKSLDLLSGLPFLETGNLIEDYLVMASWREDLLPCSDLFFPAAAKKKGVGALTLVKASAYLASGGHSLDIGKQPEDILLAQRISKWGGTTGFYNLSALVKVRLYKGFRNALQTTVNKQMLGISLRRCPFTLRLKDIAEYVVPACLLIYFATKISGGAQANTASLIFFGTWYFVTASSFYYYKKFSRVRILSALTFPIAYLLTFLLWIVSYFKLRRGNPLTWRGRQIVIGNEFS